MRIFLDCTDIQIAEYLNVELDAAAVTILEYRHLHHQACVMTRNISVRFTTAAALYDYARYLSIPIHS